MAMELEPDAGGHWLFTLGVVEKWVVTVGASILLASGYWFTSSVTSRLDAMSAQQSAQATQLAVANAQLAALTVSLADVPALNVRLSRVEVRQETVIDQIREMRATRGLK